MGENNQRIYTKEELPARGSSELEEFLTNLGDSDIVSGEWLNSLKPTSIGRDAFLYSLNGKKYLFEAVNPNESASGIHIHIQYKYVKL